MLKIGDWFWKEDRKSIDTLCILEKITSNQFIMKCMDTTHCLDLILMTTKSHTTVTQRNMRTVSLMHQLKVYTFFKKQPSSMPGTKSFLIFGHSLVLKIS